MPALFIFIVVVAAIVLVWSFIQNQKRREALMAFAGRRGLNFDADDPFDIPEQYGAFALMQHGHGRRASNVLWGNIAGRGVLLFQYRYTTGSGKNQTTHHRVACLWGLPVPLTDMAIRPEGVFDRVTEWFGHNDIDFESSEFSRRYYVKGDDRREVYAVMAPRMMAFMLERGMEYLEILGDDAMVYARKSDLTPERCRWLLDFAEGFDANLPDHVVRQKKERVP